MIKGTGVDIIEISRIKQALNKNEAFLQRVYTTRELDSCTGNKPNISSLAARFAAKEAIAKVLGTGIGKIRWIEIEVLNNQDGKPEVILYGNAKTVAAQKNINQIEVTLSHSREYAIAFAIAY